MPGGVEGWRRQVSPLSLFTRAKRHRPESPPADRWAVAQGDALALAPRRVPRYPLEIQQSFLFYRLLIRAVAAAKETVDLDC